jgi:hypothetical protein
MEPNVYDCLLYNGEIDLLEVRLHELAESVHRFVIVEADTTFRGARKTPRFDPLDPRVTPFANSVRYVLVKDMPRTGDAVQLEAWQRNAILRGVPDAAPEDLVLVSNVDEIPRATAVKEMVADAKSCIFGLRLACYRLHGDYRDVAGPGSTTTGSVAARRAEFDRIAPHDLRHDVQNGRVPARFLSGAGWHFSSGSSRRRTGVLDPPPFPMGALRWLFGGVVSPGSWRGRPKRPGAAGSESRPYRNCAVGPDIVDLRELPSRLQANREALARLFSSRHTVARVTSPLLLQFPRPLRSGKAAAPPVIICPYVHSHEAAEMRAKFGLEEPRGRKLEFFLWQDTDGIGPERAFQHCWDRFPDRDIVILHSDMAPMPDDRSNCWYDALLQHRKKLPQAGMLACNLFYPRARQDEPWRVQCAGGTFREGQTGHMHGAVYKGVNATADGVPAAALRKVRAVDWVTFAGVLIRREVIGACGPVDDRYRWAYIMDVDYCFEARLRGFQLFQVPVQLEHQAGRTTRALREADPKLSEQISRNFELFSDKWRPFLPVLASIS